MSDAKIRRSRHSAAVYAFNSNVLQRVWVCEIADLPPEHTQTVVFRTDCAREENRRESEQQSGKDMLTLRRHQSRFSSAFTVTENACPLAR